MKYRHWDFWRFDFYLFQDGRWEIGISFDVNGYPLLSIQLVIFFIEFNFMRGFKEWKNPSKITTTTREEQIKIAEELYNKYYGTKTGRL